MNNRTRKGAVVWLAPLIAGSSLAPLQGEPPALTGVGRHGNVSFTDDAMLHAATDDFQAKADSPGKFGRMFPALPPFIPDEQALRELAAKMIDTAPDTAGNSAIPAVYTYFGQFVDHDITFDLTPLGSVPSSPAVSFRSPELSLDSVYGAGPQASPMLYDRRDGDLFALGRTDSWRPDQPDEQRNDLLRTQWGRAVIGDPRNDENLVIAQLHLTVQRAHNKIVRSLGAVPPGPRTRFETARQTLLWHYQWIVVNDFLRRVLDQGHPVLDTTLLRGPRIYRPGSTGPYMPLEFSGAAYRFGHSLVRERYQHVNFPTATLEKFFEFTGNGNIVDHRGLSAIWAIDWAPFITPDTSSPNPNFARLVDPLLSPTLQSQFNLAELNLRRGRMLGLPSGQAVVDAVNRSGLGYTIPKLTRDQLTTGPDGEVAGRHGFDVAAPLWYYILKESEQLTGGQRLGPTGSVILAEVFVGLLLTDKDSYLTHDPQWQPTLKLKDGTPVNTLLQLLRFATE